MSDQYLAQIRVGLGQPGPSSSMAPKRPFQELENGGEEIQDSSPGCPSTAGASPNKRARSEGSPPADASGSGSSHTLTGSSSSSAHMPVQPPTEFDVLSTEAIPDPRPPPPTLPSPTHLLTASNHLPMPTRSPLVDMHHSSVLPVPYPSLSTQSTFPHHPASSPSGTSFESTLQRAHDFELQIAAIREDITNSGASPTGRFPPTEPSRQSHSPLAPRTSHEPDLPSVEQFLNDIRSRSPPSSNSTMQTLVARRERLLSTLSLLRRERRERQSVDREETSRTRSPPAHGFYPVDVPRSPQLPQYLQLYEHILNDHLSGGIEGNYLPFDPFYIGQAPLVDPELDPLPLGLERELAEGVFHAAAITRHRPFYPAREEPRTARPRAWTTQSSPRTLFPHRSSRLDDGPPAHSTWTSSTRIPPVLSTTETETRLGRRRIPEFVGEQLDPDPWVLTRWPADAEPGATWSDRSTQRQHDHGWLPDRDRTRERDEELRQRTLARINESASLLRSSPSSPPPASYWYGGHHDATTFVPPTNQNVVDALLERTPDAPHRLEGPTSLNSILQSERRARRLPERYASASVHSGRDRELREREGQPTSSSALPSFADFRTRSGFTPNTGQDVASPFLRMFRSENSSRPTIFRPPSPHLAPSRASPPPQAPVSTAGRTDVTSIAGPSPPSPDPADTTSVLRNIDLSAYTGGPFRASLSTFREMTRRRERSEPRTQRYWDHELDRERDREIERELDLERELDRERERQRERQIELMREESMLQSMLNRRRTASTQTRAEEPDAFAAIPLPDPDARFRRIMEPPIRPAPRALDSTIHPSFPMPSPQSPRLPPTTSFGVERRDTAMWNDPLPELNRTPSFHQRRRLPVPLPIQRQREVENLSSRTHTDHLRPRTSSSPWPAYENSSYTEARVQREPGRSRRELHELLARRTRIEVVRRLSEEAHVSGPPSTAATTTVIPPPDIPSWDIGMVDFECPIFEEAGLRVGVQERAEIFGHPVPHAGPSSAQSGPAAVPNSEQQSSTSGLPRGLFRAPRIYHNRDLNPTNTSILGPDLVRRRTPPTSRSPTRGDTPSNVGSSTSAETAGPVNSTNTRSTTRAPRRAGRHRYISDYSGYHGFPFDIFDAPGSRRYANRMRNMGDYVRDEDFDDSFEGLMNLSAALGEVKQRNTPSHIIANLPSGKYSEWAAPGCDERCPVCLDDYQVHDDLLKITDCTHWFHRGCLEQWLSNANTCPVCRKRVKGKKRREQTTTDGQPEAGPSRRRNNDDDDDDLFVPGGGGGSNDPPPGAGAGAWPTFPPWYLYN
ncbi:hypothetical protein BJ322DRAFT_1046327 [Thelephora terrestris]|uniref:RING-type domain-containing protein n=1 Tax=Thelephora terrestris TaxID=56493 RepID=A0A9P6HIB9_9AGAM|nr:hypothetical protein BJ322DRAFT_1046327 [Thelephora terrestris]